MKKIKLRHNPGKVGKIQANLFKERRHKKASSKNENK